MNIMVNNSDWDLRFVEPYSNMLKRSDGTYTLGVTDNSLKCVFIADNLSDEMMDRVILHELCHVHALEYNYSIPIEIEEIVCDFLSLYGRSVVYLADDILAKILQMVA